MADLSEEDHPETIKLFDYMKKNFFHIVEGKSVLELGSFEGWYTQLLLDMNPKCLVCVEAFLDSATILKDRFQKDKKVIIEHYDMFEYLNDTLHGFDVVIACGVIYHTPAPILLLEKIVNFTAPSDIIIDLPGGRIDDKLYCSQEEGFGTKGQRQAIGYQQSGWVCSIPINIITNIMRYYEYQLYRQRFVGEFNINSKNNTTVLHYRR